MNPRLLILSTLLLYFTTASAQPDSLWSRTFGGDSPDGCFSVQQTSDGGYMLAGFTSSFGAGSDDFWLVKTNTNGDSLWSHTYGGDDDDWCHSAQLTTDGGFVLAGMTDSFGAGNRDFWLVKTNANGDSLWSRTYGGTGDDECRSIQPTADGGYVLAGYTTSFGAGNRDFWLVKTNANGDSLWSRTYGGGIDERCLSVQQTTDGGYVLAGHSQSFGSGSRDFWLVKTNANGDSLWSRAYGGSGWDECYSVQQTSDGGYVLAGGSDSFGAGRSDCWLVKANANGDSLWSRTFGGSNWENYYSLQQSTDGGYILVGWTNSFGAGLKDFWLIRTNANGDNVWSRTFGGSEYQECFSVQQTTDGGYVLAGYTSSFGAGNQDFWLVKTGPDPLDATEHFTPQPSKYSLSAFPNPFNSELTLSVTGFTRNVYISLHNLLGQKVDVIHDGLLVNTQLHYTAPASLSSGLYFIRANDTHHSRTAKIVFLK